MGPKMSKACLCNTAQSVSAEELEGLYQVSGSTWSKGMPADFSSVCAMHYRFADWLGICIVLTWGGGLRAPVVLDSCAGHGHVGQPGLHCRHIHTVLQRIQLAVIAGHRMGQTPWGVHILQT